MSVVLSMLGWLADWFHADLLTWSLRLLHVSAVGQTLFVLLWATLPWWRSTVGRALMVKSLSLALYLDWAVAVIHWGPFPAQETIAVVLFGLITAGILWQLVAIAHEVAVGRRAQNPRPHVRK